MVAVVHVKSVCRFRSYWNKGSVWIINQKYLSEWVVIFELHIWSSRIRLLLKSLWLPLITFLKIKLKKYHFRNYISKIWIIKYEYFNTNRFLEDPKMRIENYISFCQVQIELFFKKIIAVCFATLTTEANTRSSKFESLIIPTIRGRMTFCVIILGKLSRASQICLTSKLCICNENFTVWYNFSMRTTP